MEQAITGDHLFDQVMIAGKGRSFLVALVVLNRSLWNRSPVVHGLKATNAKGSSDPWEEELLQRIADR
jgi:hypothetical protein